MICNKDHRYLPDFSNLPVSQADTENDRHICCGCAYVLGLQDGLSGTPVKTVLPNTLPHSQAGTVRHKDAMSAYVLGHAKGVRLNS